MAAALRQAGTWGASAVRADTTVTNAGALAVLAGLGFDLTPAGHGPAVRARLLLEPRACDDESR